jgi:putative nucleotidyltransferase with HDIG domain
MNIHYELTVWPIYNARKEMTGRIYISHDITAMKQLENELRKLNTQLEDRVASRTHELAEAYDTTLEGWARALELRDKETEGHTRRVTDTTLKIAFKLDFPDDMIEHIRRGAILHDIGKMGIPDDILHKPDKLTKEEREIVMKHPETAYRLLKPISFLERAIDIPYCHHEKWDGTGYPRGLKGGEIPVAARIFAIADVWDALSVERSYNKPWSQEKMIAYFIEQSGKHFDPHMVNIFLDMVEKGEI